MNVSYENINTADAATMLGVTKQTVAYWCRHKLIRYTDVSNGSMKARYMFDTDELDRVNKLIEKYGAKAWINHANEGLDDMAILPVKAPEVKPMMATTDPEDYIPDNTDEVVSYVKKIRALKIQRDKLLNELDSIDEAIKTMRQKVIESI